MMFEEYLSHVLDSILPSNVKDAMSYSLMNGGKRIRPLLLLETLKGYGYKEELGYACAAGIEMIHTYSLIHDDLPAMDDDTLRRGKPSCHIAFDEATAILAGDGLLTHAFAMAAQATSDAVKNERIVRYFSRYAGCNGMILGQTLDIEAEKHASLPIEDLEKIHYYKTGMLLTLPMVCAAIITGHESDIPVWEKIGECIGLSFQIQDDLLDITSTKEELGKNPNSDAQNHKQTYATMMEMEEAQQLCDMYYTRAKKLIEQLSFDNTGLFAILDALRNRRK